MRCWRVGAMGGIVGLDYAQLQARMKKKDYEALLPSLDVICDAVLPLLNRRDDD